MENKNKEFYESFYDRISDSPTKSGNAKWEYYLLRCILKYLDKNNLNTLLDVGCGQGNKTAYLSSYIGNIKAVGLDSSHTGINLAKQLYADIKNLEFIEMNLDDFSSKSEIKYDIVSALEVLEHIEDWQTLLSKMADICNRYILLTFPTGRMRSYEVKIGHFRNFERGEVEDFLLKKGFKVVKTFYSGFPLYTPLARDYIDKHYDSFMESIDTKFTKFQELFHNLIYFSFRFFCFKNIGDKFTGLFERINITTNSNRGVNYSFLFVLNLYNNQIVNAFIYIKICECIFILNFIFLNNNKLEDK